MAGELAKYWQAAKAKASAGAKSDVGLKSAMADLQNDMNKNLSGALDKLEAAIKSKDNGKVEAQKAKVDAICEKYAAVIANAVKSTALTNKETKPMRDALETGSMGGLGGKVASIRMSPLNSINDGNEFFTNSDAKLSAKWLEKAVVPAFQRGGYSDLRSSLRTVDEFASGRSSFGQTEYNTLKARFDTFASEVTSRNPNPTSGKAVTKLRKLVAAFASTVNKHVAKVAKANDKQDAAVLDAVNDKLGKLKAFRKSILTVETVVNAMNEQAVSAIAAYNKAMLPDTRAEALAIVNAIKPKLTKAVAAADKITAKIPNLEKVEKAIAKVYKDGFFPLPANTAKAKSEADAMVVTCQKALADAKSVGNQIIGELNALR